MFRDTKQRHAIKKAIDTANRPVGPKEILTLASKEVPNLGIATVYRNIKTMVEQGELVTVELPGQAPRYQAPDSERSPHLFICEKSDSVYNIDPDLKGFKLKLPDEYKVRDFQIIAYGEVARRRRKSS